jgi:signal transduction histidine kinase
LATGSSSDAERSTAAPRRAGLRLGLRVTLLVTLLPLLALPWAGLRFVERMAESTRDAQWDTQQAAARSLAASLHERHELFGLGDDPARIPRGMQPVSPDAMPSAADAGAADGAPVRWQPLPVQAEGGAPVDTLEVAMSLTRFGGDRPRLLLAIQARDERLVLPGELDTAGPGPVVQPGDAATVLVGGEDELVEAIAADQRARATGSSRITLPELPRRIPVPLAQMEGGWRAELELPPDVRLLRVMLVDVDYLGSRKVEARADSGLLLLAAEDDLLAQAAARRRARQWDDVLRALDRGTGRVAIFDAGGELLAARGEPTPPARGPDDFASRLARILLAVAVRLGPGDDQPAEGALSPLAGALAGVPARESRRIGSQGNARPPQVSLAPSGGGSGAVRPWGPPEAGMPVWQLSSAHPVWVGDRVAGALLLEETTAAQSSLAQRALERLALLVSAALAVTALTLLGVASLAVSRIMRLRRAAEAAIDARGRVVGSVPRFRLRDEVDAMAGSYNRVLARLREHQDYLAKLRGRLVHELRTPIMVVRSSLDNLAAESDPQRIGDYAARAQAGATRLERIVASMGEAASLEAMLEESDLDMVDLVALVAACIDGYRTAYPDHRLRLDAPAPSARCPVVPEAIAQALDKLVANATDFAAPGSEIVVAVEAEGRDCWRIAVANQGPPLPQEMADSLFESMVSVRGAARGGPDARGHLGLGLYLVRLIAEFHGGAARARNRPGGVEVGFTIAAVR